MAASAEVRVRVTGLPAFKDLLGAVAELIRVLGAHAAELPPDVVEACDGVRKALGEAGSRDIGPPPEGDGQPIATG